MRQTFRIPDCYYDYGRPIHTDYNAGDGSGLTYKEGGEKAFELACAFGGSPSEQYTTISLTSPYIVGWDNVEKERALVSVDIDNRKVVVDIKEEPSV
jgi:hypothetical protein